LKGASVSTFHIGSECGALISREDFSNQVVASQRLSCARNGRFESEAVRARVSEADLVILVAAWKEWQVRYLNETVGSLKAIGAKNVIVIGRKSFGRVAPLLYRGKSQAEKKSLRNAVDPEHRATNDLMKATLSPSVFVDFQKTVCEDDGQCPVFTEDGRLISFDGTHLTREGAVYVGQRLFRHRLLASLPDQMDPQSQ
jgi:hypothetical protein